MIRRGAHVLVAVGSRSDKVCSIGAFARAEARALTDVTESVRVLEPDELDRYPAIPQEIRERTGVVLFHSPALHDRKRPWNAVWSALRVRRALPRALFVPVVHEYVEAPVHWRVRQLAILMVADGAIVNTSADHEAVTRWMKNTRGPEFAVLRSRLGPTLFLEGIEGADRLEKLRRARIDAREYCAVNFGLPAGKKWVLAPGLITPGKGLEAVVRLAPAFGEGAHFILLGGTGPKGRDHAFLEEILRGLRVALGDRFTFAGSPGDEDFKRFLTAADLVILPYERGLSERRSSFLSSMSCGANVFTTLGPYSGPMEISGTGVHAVPAGRWGSGEEIGRLLREALAEGVAYEERRRLSNLDWSRRFAWPNRAAAMASFIASLAARGHKS